MRLDPLTRGSLFHKVQAEFFRELKRAGALPVVQAAIPDAVRVLGNVLDREAAAYAERLAPAIDRVWRDEIAELRRDLGSGCRKLAEQPDWIPQ